ncbi:NHL repeat-containing protein [Ochrovirga pacifica]|uniref:hypothetical protein n=1 Tax=Ochrovirga pacifica TaxID=1042376 RepID=UPI000255A2C9|nr:hypothetical protein [Ochrovirga pacifica]
MELIRKSTILFFLTVNLVYSQTDVIYDAPDQVVWHKQSQTWFVSNLGGGISLAEDENAWITRLDKDGKVLNKVWIGKKEKMHAISGMTITKNYLFACDRNGVYKINIKEAKVDEFYKLEGAKFVNDIVRAKNGDLYVSDFFGNKIYKITEKTKEIEVWLETSRLESPDGLYMEKDKLIVGSWGVLKTLNTFETTKFGDLLSIDLKTKKITSLVKEIGNIEGITKSGKHYYITDWASGKVLKVDAKKKTVEVFISGLSHPTDPNYSEELNVLGFPQHGTNQVLFIKL